jgi:hypothetical protein
MELPYNLQRLPPEALEVLRYLGKHGPAAAVQIETGTGMANRLVGKAIRRLVNFDYIELSGNTYQLTTDGTLATRQLNEYDAAQSKKDKGAASAAPQPVYRRLAVVMPRILAPNKASDLFIGVNPPDGGAARLPMPAHLELRVSAVYGALSIANLSLSVPPDRAAAPGRLSLTPATPGRAVRVRVDAFQAMDADHMELEPLGGMYFDVKVAMDATGHESAIRAVGMDIQLKPSRG